MLDRLYIEKFINKLLELTKAAKLDWQPIPRYFENHKNERFRHYIVAQNQYAYNYFAKGFSAQHPTINEYGSYCVEANGGLVILLNYEYPDPNQCRLAVQIDTMESVELLDCTSADLQKLNMIKKLIREDQYSVARYIVSFLDE